LLNVKTPLPTRNSVVDGAQATHSGENDEGGKDNRTATSKIDVTKPVADHKDEYQIRLDTDRSFVLYPGGERSFPRLQPSL